MIKLLEKLEKDIGYTFKDKKLIELALTHASYPQKTEAGDNERIEFFGDRVLGFVLAQYLFDKQEAGAVKRMAGDLAFLGSRDLCAQVADQLQLFDAALIADGLSTNWQDNIAVHANLCEALIGAIYLDGGMDSARQFVERFWQPWLVQARAGQPSLAGAFSPKNALQEHAQAQGAMPVYRLVERSGSEHQPLFTIEVFVEGMGSSTGQGTSRQGAEKLAAQNLLNKQND